MSLEKSVHTAKLKISFYKDFNPRTKEEIDLIEHNVSKLVTAITNLNELFTQLNSSIDLNAPVPPYFSTIDYARTLQDVICNVAARQEYQISIWGEPKY